MRSEGSTPSICEDTDVKVICAVEAAAEEYKDCPVACRANEENNNEEPAVVKSGDLAVTAKASSTKKAIIGGISDLDTLTFKTSEDVTLTRVNLERYGYSAYSDIDTVWLEDADGNVIADAKPVTSKDEVSLLIDRKYRSVDGTLNATIVVKLEDSAKVWETVWFKVVSVDSTAKNLDIADYDPNTYDVVDYDGSSVELTARWTDKTYNYAEGESYEVAKLKVKAGTAPILVKGFTLTNDGNLDIEDFLDERGVEVTVDWKAVKWLKASVDDDELTISFSEVEIASKANATFAVNVELADFDDYGSAIHFNIAETTDFNAIESKTDARVSVNTVSNMWTYTFNGGETKFSNVKLGNIDAAQWADDVLVAEGTVTVAEPLDKINIVLDASKVDGTTGAKALEAMRLSINGSEYDGDVEVKADGSATVTFKNVEIEESGKVRFYIDVVDDESYLGAKFTFNSLGVKTVKAARYANSKKSALGEIAGSVSFGTITIQKAKASLENNMDDKAVSFLANETNTNVVFDGTLSAKKANINLQEFSVKWADNYNGADDFVFHLIIDGKELKTVDLNDTASISYSLAADKEVKVQVKAEIDAWEADATRYYSNFTLEFDGEDDNGVAITKLVEPLTEMKVINKASVEVDAATLSKTVLKKGKNKTVATFTLKAENNETALELENFRIAVLADGNNNLMWDDLRVKVAWTVEDDFEDLTGASDVYTAGQNSLHPVEYTVSATLPVTVEVVAKGEYNEVKVYLIRANDKDVFEDFATAYEDVLVKVDSQASDGNETTFSYSVDKSNSSYTVSNVKFITDAANADWQLVNWGNTLTNGYSEFYKNATGQLEYVVGIAYNVSADSEKDWQCSITVTGNANPTKSECEAAYTEASTATCVRVRPSTKATTPSYACPSGYATTETTIDENTDCGKLVVTEGSAQPYTYIDGKAYSISTTETTKAVSSYADECVAYDANDYTATLSWTTCTYTSKTALSECEAAAGETVTFNKAKSYGEWTATATATRVCIFKGAAIDDSVDACNSSHTWENMNDYFKIGGKYVMISKAKSSD